MPSISALFSPLQIRGTRFKNRIVASPMWQYRGENWHPTDWHMMELGHLADGGCGLVFQEGTAVERRGCGTLGDLGLWDDRFIPPLQRIERIVRDNGAVAGIQLMHAGRKARQRKPWEGRGALEVSPDIEDWDAWEVVAPSAIAFGEGYPVPRALTLAEIKHIVQSFVQAAKRASQIGYEVLEIHGAHGYLIHQFLSSHSNQRSDAYGGSFQNRIRFLLEIVEGVRSAWPAEKPLFLRLSCVDGLGWSLDDTVALVRLLGPMGVDVVDCSSGGLAAPGASVVPLGYGYQVDFSEEVRRQTGVMTCAVGLIVHASQAEDIVAKGRADMVALARELMHNPSWPVDAAQKLDIDDPYAVAPKKGLWLRKRAEAVQSLKPSTFAAL